MKNTRGIVWGGLLVIFGMVWLLRNLNLVSFDWNEILPYWPVLLIIAGAILLIPGRERSGTSGAVALLITLAVFGGIVNRTNEAFDKRNWNWNWDEDDEDYHHDNDHDDNEEDHDRDYRREKSKKQGAKPINGNYDYEMQDFIQKADFHLEGGAGSFKLTGNTQKLFEANTKSSSVGFLSNTSINKLNSSASVNLKMEEGNIRIKNGEISNEARIQLNERPVWNIDLGIGAGKGDFDFSNYKIEKLKVSTGVADMDIKLGDKMPLSNVDIEAGVASVTLEVPNSVGCEMRVDGALNAKNIDGLDKISSGLYRSQNYESAAKKIAIKFEGGLTSINIKRY